MKSCSFYCEKNIWNEKEKNYKFLESQQKWLEASKILQSGGGFTNTG